ncbi:hypothetical protein GGF46_001883 [Coemansia sp. RSA 552]|nr:hypothetical protein GGF46_001883 [Coemansia sp. RSA 552]
MSKLAAEILAKSAETPATLLFGSKPKTLYELLNVQRMNAYKFRVMPKHWYEKGFDQCYYEVHRVKYKLYKGEPTHGKAWGIKFWSGKQLDDKPREIRGGLKFNWAPYTSPRDNGIVYDAERAQSVERRRTKLLKAYHAKEDTATG